MLGTVRFVRLFAGFLLWADYGWKLARQTYLDDRAARRDFVPPLTFLALITLFSGWLYAGKSPMKAVCVARSALAVLAVKALPLAGIFAYERWRTRDLTAEITVRAPEKGNFSPNTVVVPAGQPVRLHLRNVDTMTHGFALYALKVGASEIKAGHVKIVEFTPETPGSHPFYCTVWCSEFHIQMRGTLEVPGH